MGAATEREIFQELKLISIEVAAISTSVAVIKSQLPAERDRFDGHERRANAAFDDHEARLRRVETRMWYAVGAMAFFAWVLPTALTYLMPTP